jgi:hypothetical protein
MTPSKQVTVFDLLGPDECALFGSSGEPRAMPSLSDQFGVSPGESE